MTMQLSSEVSSSTVTCSSEELGSSIEHIKSNLDAIAKVQPLSTEIVEEIDRAWAAAKPECEKYYR